MSRAHHNFAEERDFFKCILSKCVKIFSVKWCCDKQQIISFSNLETEYLFFLIIRIVDYFAVDQLIN